MAGTAWPGVVRSDTARQARIGGSWRGVARHGRNGVARQCMARWGTARQAGRGTARHGVERQGMARQAWLGQVRHGEQRYGRRGMARKVMAWNGTARQAWHGKAWRGLVGLGWAWRGRHGWARQGGARHGTAGTETTNTQRTRMTPEAKIVADIRIALGMDSRVLVWRNSTGVAESDGRKIRFGLVRGGSDLVGLVAPNGRLFALEVKAPRGRLSPEQKQFIFNVRRMGGFAAVVRTVQEAQAAVDAAVRGDRW